MLRRLVPAGTGNAGTGTRTRRQWNRVFCGAGLLAILALPAFAEEWFDAYERGLEALKHGQPQAAVEALERAVRKRPEPGSNVFTYGTNRLGRYHPYLRLAEAYLELGDTHGARLALERSLHYKREPEGERAALSQKLFALTADRPTPSPRPTPAASAAPTPVTAPASQAVAVSPATAAPAATGTPTPTAPLAGPEPSPALAGGTLELGSDPPDASVLVAGRLVGVTPLRIELHAGAVTVTLRKAGYAELSVPLRVDAGRVTRVRHTLLPLASSPPARATAWTGTGSAASLAVLSDPPGATVYLDDEPVGATDPLSGRLVKSGIAAGPHRVRLSRTNHLDTIGTVLVPASGTSTFRGTLVRRPPSHRGLAVLAVALLLMLGLLLLAWRNGRLALTLRTAAEVVTPSHGTPQTTPAPTATTPPATLSEAETQGLRAPTPPASATLAPKTPASGERFGGYTLVQQIGRGGMAVVYKAEREGTFCALKRPLPALLDDREFLERFRREADIGRTLHHPNIIRVQERGEVEGVPYFTMELIAGETLNALLKERGAFETREAVEIIAQVAEALDYAHLKGVIHRDLKPSNIMVTTQGTALVMDYGIARARRFEGLTLTGSFLGTPDYVAPETAEGQGADARSDLYSLGVVFYEVLTGRRPFVGETPFATLKKHCSEPPTPPSAWRAGLAPELEAVVLRLLQKDPAQRYASAEELLIALRELR